MAFDPVSVTPRMKASASGSDDTRMSRPTSTSSSGTKRANAPPTR
jgi:hypothetical protein